MAAGELPEWLPPGWTVELRVSKRGRQRRYYTSPESGQSFCSKMEVLRYLNIEKGIGGASKQRSNFVDDNRRLAAQVEDSPKLLPSGWILEVKTVMSGSSEGKKYKCYFDPSTGLRFYSKKEVFRYLEKGKGCSSSSKNKKNSSLADNVCSSSSNNKKNSSLADNVLSQFQYTPDGLPHGWIKEIKFRKVNSGKGVRKDPYYTDPESGYVFRSLRDVFRYIETGVVSKHAIRGNKRQISGTDSLEKEYPLPIAAKKPKGEEGVVKRCLFSGQIPDSNGEIMMNIDQSPEKPQIASSVHLSSQSEQAKMEAKKGGNKVLKQAIKELPESVEKSIVKAEEERERVSEPGSSESMGKEPPETFNQIPPCMSERKQLDLIVGSPTEMEEEHLELESGRLPIPEVKLLEPESEKRLQEEKVSELENQLFLLEEQQSQSACERSDKKVKKHGARTTNAQKAISLPRRVSKRLAGIEPDHLTDLGAIDRSHRVESRASGKLKDTPVKDPMSCNQHGEAHIIDLELLEDPERKETLQEQVTLEEQAKETLQEEVTLGEQAKETLQEQVTSGEQAEDWKPAEEWPDSPLALPFGDSWPDPCIEFAFKTLTGDIPVLNDSLRIEEYFQQQLASLQISSSDCLASLPSDVPATQPDPALQMKGLEKCSPSSGEEREPFPLENGLLSNGKVKTERRRSTRLKKLGA